MSDPIKDPQVGDIIQQPSGLKIRVTKREGDRVEWDECVRGSGWRRPNAWSLSGWTKNVCHNATIIDSASAAE